MAYSAVTFLSDSAGANHPYEVVWIYGGVLVAAGIISVDGFPGAANGIKSKQSHPYFSYSSWIHVLLASALSLGCVLNAVKYLTSGRPISDEFDGIVKWVNAVLAVPITLFCFGTFGSLILYRILPGMVAFLMVLLAWWRLCFPSAPSQLVTVPKSNLAHPSVEVYDFFDVAEGNTFVTWPGILLVLSLCFAAYWYIFRQGSGSISGTGAVWISRASNTLAGCMLSAALVMNAVHMLCPHESQMFGSASRAVNCTAAVGILVVGTTTFIKSQRWAAKWIGAYLAVQMVEIGLVYLVAEDQLLGASSGVVANIIPAFFPDDSDLVSAKNGMYILNLLMLVAVLVFARYPHTAGMAWAVHSAYTGFSFLGSPERPPQEAALVYCAATMLLTVIASSLDLFPVGAGRAAGDSCQDEAATYSQLMSVDSARLSKSAIKAIDMKDPKSKSVALPNFTSISRFMGGLALSLVCLVNAGQLLDSSKAEGIAHQLFMINGSVIFLGALFLLGSLDTIDFVRLVGGAVSVLMTYVAVQTLCWENSKGTSEHLAEFVVGSSHHRLLGIDDSAKYFYVIETIVVVAIFSLLFIKVGKAYRIQTIMLFATSLAFAVSMVMNAAKHLGSSESASFIVVCDYSTVLLVMMSISAIIIKLASHNTFVLHLVACIAAVQMVTSGAAFLSETQDVLEIYKDLAESLSLVETIVYCCTIPACVSVLISFRKSYLMHEEMSVAPLLSFAVLLSMLFLANAVALLCRLEMLAWLPGLPRINSVWGCCCFALLLMAVPAGFVHPAGLAVALHSVQTAFTFLQTGEDEKPYSTAAAYGITMLMAVCVCSTSIPEGRTGPTYVVVPVVPASDSSAQISQVSFDLMLAIDDTPKIRSAGAVEEKLTYLQFSCRNRTRQSQAETLLLLYLRTSDCRTSQPIKRLTIKFYMASHAQNRPESKSLSQSQIQTLRFSQMRSSQTLKDK